MCLLKSNVPKFIWHHVTSFDWKIATARRNDVVDFVEAATLNLARNRNRSGEPVEQPQLVPLEQRKSPVDRI